MPGAWNELTLMSEHLASCARSLVRTFRPDWIAGGQACKVSIVELHALLEGVVLPGIPPELARAARLRQQAYLAGRLCAEHALEQLGLHGSMIARGHVGEPIWPRGWTGSISHSRDEAIAVVSKRRSCFDLGVDIEHVVERDMILQLLRTCLSPIEVATHVPDLARASLPVTALFSIKEAYFKSIHPVVQRHVDFLEVHVSELNLQSGRFVVGAGEASLTRHAMPTTKGFVQWANGVVISWVVPEPDTQLGSFTYTGVEREVN